MDAISRRTFLQTAAGAATSCLAACKSAAPGGGGASLPRPCPPSAWHKHGIILAATEPWEDGQIQNFTSPAEPLKGGAWRFWYSVSGRRNRFHIAFAEGEPGGPMRKCPAQCSPREAPDAPLGIGNLPEGWRPVQVIHLRLRDGRHRLYFWAHGEGILRYLAADSADGRRYRVGNPLRPVLYHPHDRAAHGVASPDGLLLHPRPDGDRPADEPPASAGLISNDATTVYQLADGSFELYSVALVPVPRGDPAYVPHDNAPGLVRVIDRYVSEDGLHFEARRRIIERDWQDPADQQFYYLAVTRTPRGCVGMLGHYRCQAQTMDLEWCFSRDGVSWERPCRSPWLPRGEPPAADCYGIYAGQQLVWRDGRWHLFYTGVNSAHNERHSHGPPRQVVMYASAATIWG